MNPSLALLLLGGAAVVAVAAANSNDSKEPPSGESELVTSSRKMVFLFNLYSAKQLAYLTDEELVLLATMNAEAKGQPKPDKANILSVAHFKMPSQELDPLGKVQGEAIPAGLAQYRQTFFLPPLPDNAKPAPDIYSAWAGETRLVCRDGGFGDACHRGYYQDWFGRNYGKFEDESSDVIVISSHIYDFAKGITDIPTVLRAVATAAAMYPGIGTVISVAITFLVEVGEGASYEDAALTAARAAIPPQFRPAYDIGVGLIVDHSLNVEELAVVAMATAISMGAIDGEVLEYYRAIEEAYKDAQAVYGEARAVGEGVSAVSSGEDGALGEYIAANI